MKPTHAASCRTKSLTFNSGLRIICSLPSTSSMLCMCALRLVLSDAEFTLLSGNSLNHSRENVFGFFSSLLFFLEYVHLIRFPNYTFFAQVINVVFFRTVSRFLVLLRCKLRSCEKLAIAFHVKNANIYNFGDPQS